MSTKRSLFATEGAGPSRVVVQIEHIDENTPSLKKPRARKDVNRRRKPAPKTIEFQLKGSLNSPAQQYPWQAETPIDSGSNDQTEQDEDDLFANWREDLNDVAQAAQSVEPGDETGETGKTSERKTPNFILRQWKALFCDSYVQAMYDREAPPTTECCDLCQAKTDRFYRCEFCEGSCWLCSACLVQSHRFKPTHRPQYWDGACWTDTSLRELGLVFNLGHRGAACSMNTSVSPILAADMDGFTTIQVRYCKHANAPPKSVQLISAGYFPCSDQRPETVFSLKLLDRFDAFNTTGRTSAHKVYSVLQRATKAGFPGHVSDRYREFLTTYHVHPGDQAFDCVACPRPGFNFYWDEVPEDLREWFWAWFSYDGNFRSYRKNKKVDSGDIILSDGDAFFSLNEAYEEWIRSHPVPQKPEEKPVCDNHKAARDSSVKAAGRDITGIGAFTCTSHSCIAPRGMVNFRGGEKQINCDYAFTSMYKYCSARGMLPIGMTYDIWCHWWKKFFQRIRNLPADLVLPVELDLIGAVGKWHLLGHNRECWIQWTLDHMQYVGRMEGEGPERVWAHFNEHSGSTSEQGPGLRIDTLNNIACDWNFSKAIEMHETLAARFREAKKSQEREQIEHEKLTASLPRKTILDWELEPIEPEDKHKDESWKNWTSPFMDPLIKGGLQETIQEERENEKKAASGGGKRNGAVRWILEGIELEHSAQKLRDEEKALGLQLKPRQANTVNSKRIALRDRVDAFLEKRSLYMFNASDPDSPRVLEFVGEDGEWTNSIDLGLPSSYMYATLVNAGLSVLADLEAKLRRGVCKDALESVKRQLGGKSAAIKHKRTEASGQAAVTRAEAVIQSHTVKIHKIRWRYLNSRDALLRLGATETDLKEYQDLKLDDLKPLKTYYDKYAESVGHGVSSMPWIWKSTVARNVDQWEIQALKTKWFRSRERFKRWDEQLVLTKREMVMSIRSFQSHQEIWEWKARNGQATPGMRAYACRRSRFFAALARQMLDSSLEYLKDNVVRFSWAEKWLVANVSGELSSTFET
ncbi:hypothetical protein FRC08_006518 [Ceratobasidium sp. 394]|nr:hypothetical protein FRC08_006518 [Ceratobasidium sp. 394]